MMNPLPEPIEKAIQKTILSNPERCYDPVKSKEQCLRMSYALMTNIGDVVVSPYPDCKIVHRKRHFWVYFDGWHIDLTARQFNSSEPCPKIWKHEEANCKNLYMVQNGKGKVLFELVPFNGRVTTFSKLKNLFTMLRSAIVSLYVRRMSIN